YDICEPKRLYRVRKVAYSFALGGQKSVLEIGCLNEMEVDRLAEVLYSKIKPTEDKINIFEFFVENVKLFGKAKRLTIENGEIIL
ncbi:MAG: CRISPR-associated endonuclease Cas2, partial [Campylobacterales bacterium]|nr:CRISPR-associated endonuclease Cas2 [Campylobacterales bacterium]